MDKKTVKASVERSAGIEVSDMMFGFNVEHMGRIIYGGIYDRDCKCSDEQGYRRDVLEAAKDMHLSAIRYPGGNFVSGYHWRDGIGKDRPIRRNLAWFQVEPNVIGLHEMADYVEKIGSKIMMNVNMGSGTIDEAVDLFEYCNFTGDTTLTRERKANGREKPFGFRYWCLGNEIDGRWQIGNLPAREYGLKAKETARLMRLMDPDVRLTLVGSSKPLLKTCPEWDKEVLDIAYELVDAISVHLYYDCPDYIVMKNKSTADYVGSYIAAQRQIDLIYAIIRETKLRKNSKHDVYIAFDEWNVWHRAPEYDSPTKWNVEERRLECIYNFRDCVLQANMINTLVRNADKVKIAAVAQLVNCIAPIMTRADGAMFKQTIYHAYRFAATHLQGGKYLPVRYECPMIETETWGEYEQLNIVSVEKGAELSFMAVNNSVDNGADIEIALDGDYEVVSSEILKNEEFAVNSFENPDNVCPVAYDVSVESGALRFSMPTLCVAMIVLRNKEYVSESVSSASKKVESKNRADTPNF